MNMQFQEVPPPKMAPENPTAKALGLSRGLRVEKGRGQFRCANCSQMQPDGAMLVWVSDGARIGDPGWSIEERERLNAYNGHGSGWCLSCAQKLCGTHKPWWKFW